VTVKKLKEKLEEMDEKSQVIIRVYKDDDDEMLWAECAIAYGENVMIVAKKKQELIALN